MYILNWLRNSAQLQPHYIYCSPVIKCLVLPLTLFFPLFLPRSVFSTSLCSLQQAQELLVLHFTADSTCWGSTFHIITTLDTCGPEELWLVEEPLTLETQTANEVPAPECREEGSKSMASGVRGSADTHSHCRLLKTHSRVPIQLWTL